jgi:hypothetical protein
MRLVSVPSRSHVSLNLIAPAFMAAHQIAGNSNA